MTNPDYTNMRFEDLLEQLEALIEKMGSDDVGIEEATEMYEKAQTLQQVARDRLENVRERAERLTSAVEEE